MMKFLLGGAAATALVAFVPAIAQPAPPPPPGVATGTAPMPQIRTEIHRLERKTESRDELVAHIRDMFARMDSNKDGFVTREEADAGHKMMADGIRRKFAARLPEGGLPRLDRGAMFDRLDANKDGSISRDEFVKAKPEVRQERHVLVMRDGEGPVEVGGGPGQHNMRIMRMHDRGMGMHGRLFERADANRDGRVSLQEMTAMALQHFDSADANHDGKLTPDERMQMHRVIRGRRAQL